MAARGAFGVIVATDGSPAAIAAVATTIAFPWPARARVNGVVARRTPSTAGRPGYVLAAWDRHWARVAASATRALVRRWPDAAVAIVDDTPADAILAEAKRRDADVIVLGWRGHGAFHRFVMGSVSREVVRRAATSVLVTRRRARALRHIVVGFDGSPSARRTIDLLARLAPPRGGLITVVAVAEPVTAPTLALMPRGVREVLHREAAAVERERMTRAERSLKGPVERLAAAGWKVRTAVRCGAPLTELLRVVETAGANVLAVGTRGNAAVERLILGSVAEGAINRARVPVLVTP